MKYIDAHQHFWNFDPADFPWISEEMRDIQHSFLPQDLQEEISIYDCLGTIVVQARQTISETKWLLEIAQKNEMIKGVVGWLDLCSPSIETGLGFYAQDKNLLGIRHVLHDESDPAYMLRPDFINGLRSLSFYDLTYDLLIFPKHLKSAIILAKRLPKQIFILDHIAKPNIKRGNDFEEWSNLIFEMGKQPNVYAKLSGMVTEADWKQHSPDDFTPYINVIFEAFGEDRIMLGSDWPVCLLAGTYSTVMNIVFSWCQENLSSDTCAKIGYLNVYKAYRRLNI